MCSVLLIKQARLHQLNIDWLLFFFCLILSIILIILKFKFQICSNTLRIQSLLTETKKERISSANMFISIGKIINAYSTENTETTEQSGIVWNPTVCSNVGKVHNQPLHIVLCTLCQSEVSCKGYFHIYSSLKGKITYTVVMSGQPKVILR